MDTLVKKIQELFPFIPVDIINKLVELIKSWLDEGVIINGKNHVSLEGYVTKLKFDPEARELKFNLGHISTSVKTPGKCFPMYIPVVFNNRAAEELSKRTHEGMYVEAEAKLRGYEKRLDIRELTARGIKYFKYTEFLLIGTHITGAAQIKQRITLPEESNAE